MQENNTPHEDLMEILNKTDLKLNNDDQQIHSHLTQASLQISGSLAQTYRPRQTSEHISRDLRSSSEDTTQRRIYKIISTGNSEMCVA